MVAETDKLTSEQDWPVQTRPTPSLPPRLRLLCIGPQQPSWVSLTLQLDAEGCLEPQFRWVSTSHEALTLLREESFDCMLIADVSEGTRDRTQEDPLALLRAIRASGCDDPVVLITPRITDERWAEVCNRDCELLVTPNMWESLALVPMIKRAVSRVETSRENRRLGVANHRRLVRERDEAEHLLRQQRQIVHELEALAYPSVSGPASEDETLEPASSDTAEDVCETSFPSESSAPRARPRFQVPAEINEYYHELLRTYVIMGSGSLGAEIAKLAELLSVGFLSPRETLELHLERVETLVRGLGNRSTRHVMARADLLALELMIHLGECYQRMLIAQQPRGGADSTPIDAPSFRHAESA